MLAVLRLHDVKYRDPNGIIFDISAHGWGGAVKDVGTSMNSRSGHADSFSVARGRGITSG